MNFMDSVFSCCILMESAEDRVAHVSSVLLPRIPGCHIIKAVDGRSDNAFCVASAMFKGPVPPMASLSMYQRCAMATKLSHMRALAAFLGSGKPHGVIFEDDAVPHEGYHTGIQEAISALPEAYDMIYVHVPQCFRAGNRHRVSPSSTVVKAYETYTTVCYAVSRKGAELILGLLENEPHKEPIDVDFVRYIKDGKLDAYVAVKDLVGTAGQPCQGSPEGMPSRIWNDRAS